MKIPFQLHAADGDETPSAFAAACGGCYDSAADGIASNFGALDLEAVAAEGTKSGGMGCALLAAARHVVRRLPGAAARRSEALSGRLARVIALDRGARK